MIRLSIIGMLIGLALATSAQAAQYCVSTNDRQEAALTWVVQQANVRIAAENDLRQPPVAPETNDTYLKARFREVVRSYVQRHQAETVDNALTADVQAATDSQKTKIRNIITCEQVVCP